MKKWKPMFRKFLWGHDLRSSPQGRGRVNLIFKGDNLEIWKWVFHHIFNSMRSFWNYLHIWKRLSRNQDIVVWRILVDLETRVKCRNWANSKSQNCFLLMNSSRCIESITFDIFEFEWVKLILSTFEASPSISEREDEESQEDISKIISVLNYPNAWPWFLRVKEHVFQFSSNLEKVWCQN